MNNKDYPNMSDFVGPRIRELCEKRKMTKYRLSMRTGIAQTELGKITSGASIPNLITLQKICAEFGISLSQFFAADGTRPDLTGEETELLNIRQNLSSKERKVFMNVARAFREDDTSAASPDDHSDKLNIPVNTSAAITEA